MHYDEFVEVFFQPCPDGTPVPDVVSGGAPARQLRDAAEPLAMHACWNRKTNESLAELGLDVFTSYVGGRAASLGVPTGPVVASAFAWFEPAFIAGLYETASAAVPRDRLLAVRDKATTESLRDVLSGDDPTAVADLLTEAVETADGTGRLLFSGLRGRGVPADPVQRLWWACDSLREHRGDSHVAAAAAAGITAVEMNVLTELWVGMPLLSYTATRVWPEAAMSAAVDGLKRRGWVSGDGLTTAGRLAREEVEARTDAQEESIVVTLGDRLPDVCARLNDWSSRCIAAGGFPSNVLKRAAG